MALYILNYYVTQHKLVLRRTGDYFYKFQFLCLLMKYIGIVIFIIFFLGTSCVFTQVSPDCGNAVPICNNTPVNGGTNGYGNDDFNDAVASGCLEKTITGFIESNSAWYKFRTGASGQLGFNIGFDTSEDWDFALYRASDCSNLGDPVRCNFFDNQDKNAFMGVGEDPTGDTDTVLYEDWLQVSPGEDYYLLINNFSNSNSGVSIQFSGQIFVTNPFDALDCSIINNLLGPPISACENDTVILDATTTNAVTYNWFMDIGSGFAQITGANDPTFQVMVSALYRVEVITPSNNNIISDVQVVFSNSPQTFQVSDDVSCSDMATYDLSVKDSEALGVQSPNEYIVSYHVSQADAINGVDFLPKSYTMSIGTQTIYVRVTSLGNSNCFDASEYFRLTVLETPVLDFPTEVYLCEDGSITIGDTMPDPSSTYVWDSGELTSSVNISQAGIYTLTVTNAQGGLSCSSSSSVTVIVSTPPEIADVIVEDLQNNNTVTIITDMEGDWKYRLDQGEFRPGNTFSNVFPGMHTVTVNDPKGCGSVTEKIVIVGFPKFFTPNGDSSNDEWHIEGISNLENPEVFIYDRYGKLLQRLNDQSTGWDGTTNGKILPSSDYWFKLTYESIDGQRTTAKYINNHFSLKR